VCSTRIDTDCDDRFSVRVSARVVWRAPLKEWNVGRHQNAFEKLAGVPLKNAFAVVFTLADYLFFFNKFDDFSSLKVL